MTASTDDVASRLDRLAILQPGPRTVVPLPGGLTNRNYRVDTPSGRFVVRVALPGAGALAINRDHEYRNSQLAAEAGIGAPVLEYAPDLGLLVVGYLDGVTLTDAMVTAPGNLHRIAAACRQLHGGRPFVNHFDMFQVQRRYLAIVLEQGYRLPAGYLDYADSVERLRLAVASRPEPLVPCNNDLLAANFIDDGHKIWLIDYEYSGNNEACFELGNLAAECHLDDDQLAELIRAYFGQPLRHKRARAKLLGLMGQYGWTLWASIQHATSSIDFDFWSWGLEKYESAVALFDGPEFERLLTDLQCND